MRARVSHRIPAPVDRAAAAAAGAAALCDGVSDEDELGVWGILRFLRIVITCERDITSFRSEHNDAEVQWRSSGRGQGARAAPTSRR